MKPIMVALVALTLGACAYTPPPGVKPVATYTPPTKFELTSAQKEQVRARIIASLKDPRSRQSSAVNFTVGVRT